MNPLDLRTQIPITSECAFFNTGASGPSPTPVLDAATGFITHHKTIAPYTDGMYPHADSAYESSRETIATHLGTAPENIALTESTTDSIGMVAGAIDWQPGDVIVRTDTEHPAGVLPWERAARVHGATVEVLETDAGVIDREQFTDAVADARVVCFSSLVWSYGNRVPVRELVEIAHDHDTFVIVDAVQSAGQMAVDLSEWGADVVAGSGHKWLLGPWGSGYLYVDPDSIDQLHPQQVCYRGVVDPNTPAYELKPNALRFERSTASPAPHVGMAAGIELIESIGLDTVESRIESLTDRLKSQLPEERLYGPRSYHSGLVSFDVDNPDATVETLKQQGFILRSIPDIDAIRVSVHVFNTEDEVDRVAAAISELL